jgi:hypothetical protein
MLSVSHTKRLNIIQQCYILMDSKKQEEHGHLQREIENNTLLTLSNIQYLVEGLDTLLLTDLDGHKRARVIQLRNKLTTYISSMFDDYP